MKNKKKVIVGLSGGVDSSVTAYLLQQQGYKVAGIFMQNWQSENDDPHCLAEQDLSDARAVCEHLSIPFHLVNFAKDYWGQVFQYCLDEFAASRTPNPDIWCNKYIKFKALLDHALELGADYLATGHYVQKSENDGQYQLLKGQDPNKEQSYFLYTLGQHELKHSLFPIGALAKTEVRAIAEKIGLHNHAKKDSTGICFIGERPFKQFLNEFLLSKPGPMKTPEGKVLGQHDGLMFYTLGQRKGLNLGGQKECEQNPWYVVNKDVANNTLIVAQGHDHPLLYQSNLTCAQLHWVTDRTPKFPLACHAKTRYRQADQACTIEKVNDDQLLVQFNQPQRAITPGQSVVFYQDDYCLGGGTIL